MCSDCTVGLVARHIGGDLHGDGSIVLRDVTHDSREATPGRLFCAIRGFRVDGHDYVDDAERSGASGFLVERLVDSDLPQILVPDVRAAMAAAAAEVHGHPSRRMNVIGITGTNGKTTVTYMLESISRAAGISCGRVGTLGATINGVDVPIARTTPESSDLQRLLAAMVSEGVEIVAMEVSSHAMVLQRAASIAFSVAAFTNLSQDHLDFHSNMDEYFAAKRQLFDGRAAAHVIGTFDRAGRALVDLLSGDATTAGFAERDVVRALDIVAGLSASAITLHISEASMPTTVRPGGRFNIANALVAAACASVVGISLGDIARGLSSTSRIPGRLEAIEMGQPFTVIVDYAHSPGGVETVVTMARDLCDGVVIVVVGAAGDRDIAKRPLMGAAAALAHTAIITSDNPRSEDPDMLVAAVAVGTRGSSAEVIVEVDRTSAIRLALDLAQPGDAVLILGKGHEGGQDFGDEVIPFDDRDVASSYLEQRWRS